MGSHRERAASFADTADQPPAHRHPEVPVTAAVDTVSALAECEAVIERGLTTFVEVGNALAHIRDERLYGSGYRDFDAYLQNRWSMSRRHANRLIEAADVTQQLGPMGPTSERQARELVGLDPEIAAQVMDLAAESGEKVTARGIREAREELTQPPKTDADEARDAAALEAALHEGDTWDNEPALTDEQCRALADLEDLHDRDDRHKAGVAPKHQRQQLTTLTNIADRLASYPDVVNPITELFPAVTQEEAARLADRFSKGIRALTRINRLLKERASTLEES